MAKGSQEACRRIEAWGGSLSPQVPISGSRIPTGSKYSFCCVWLGDMRGRYGNLTLFNAAQRHRNPHGQLPDSQASISPYAECSSATTASGTCARFVGFDARTHGIDVFGDFPGCLFFGGLVFFLQESLWFRFELLHVMRTPK